jgi:DNA-binding beta-propeller fold protein YncE
MRPQYLLFVLLLWGCRDKGTGDDTADGMLRPPVGLAVSSPAGLLYSFDMPAGPPTPRLAIEGNSATDLVVNFLGDRLFVTDASADKIIVYRLPDFPLLTSFAVGGIPLDLELDLGSTHAYVLTRNGLIWDYAIAQGELDSIDVSIDARRMGLRPPDRARLWVTCPLDYAVYQINISTRRVTDTLRFTEPPYDLCFQSDGSVAFVTTATGVHLFATEDLTPIDIYATTGQTRDVAVSANNHWLAAVDSAGGITRVWDLVAGGSRDYHTAPTAGNPRFDRQSASLYVAAYGTNEIYRLPITEQGGVSVDTMRFGESLAAFTLWESNN